MVSPGTLISIPPPPVSWRVKQTQPSTVPATLFISCSRKARILVSTRVSFQGHLYFILLEQNTAFALFTRNGISQRTFIMIFIGLLKSGVVGEKVHIVEFLIVCSLLSPLAPYSLAPASSNSGYQTLPDLISPRGSVVHFTS